ncbi:MAG: resolvase [Desulfovibrionales bacterium GWA2_65_9]|nr:MAG: resolvase [Desulfovibrionales bacterium GWA2_65_9]
MPIIAYLRVSTEGQDTKNQKLEILSWANKEGHQITDWVEREMSSRRSAKERGLDELEARLTTGDILVVAELSRLGRSVGEVVQTVDRLAAAGVGLVCIKEGIRVEPNDKGGRDMQSKMLVTLFGLLAEVERDLISERTKAGLARARAEGKKLGRPKGSIGKSRLDGREDQIRELLAKRVSKASLARILDVTPPTLGRFIASRGIVV